MVNVNMPVRRSALDDGKCVRLRPRTGTRPSRSSAGGAGTLTRGAARSGWPSITARASSTPARTFSTRARSAIRHAGRRRHRGRRDHRRIRTHRRLPGDDRRRGLHHSGRQYRARRQREALSAGGVGTARPDSAGDLEPPGCDLHGWPTGGERVDGRRDFEGKARRPEHRTGQRRDPQRRRYLS